MRLRTSLPGRHRVAPRLEALESRVALTATATQLPGGQLTIKGTTDTDHIWINDDGTRVHVFADGNDLGTFYNVPNIVLFGNGGGDTVIYNVKGDDPGGYRLGPVVRSLFADLGAGNAFFQTNIVQTLTRPDVATTISDLTTGSNLNVQVVGGTGDDVVSFNAHTIDFGANLNFAFTGGIGNDTYNVTYGAAGEPIHSNYAQEGLSVARFTFHGGTGNNIANIRMNGDLAGGYTNGVNYLSQTYVDLEGQAGNDSFVVNNDGSVVNGFVQIMENGGAGNDFLYANLVMKAGSTIGEIDAYLSGGDGDDVIWGLFRKLQPADTTAVNAFIYGNAGNDVAHYTAGVAVGSSETLELVTYFTITPHIGVTVGTTTTQTTF
jgi:hypothetical protein